MLPRLNKLKLSDIDKGTYAAVKFDDSTLDMFQELQQIMELYNPVPRDKLHSTICFSRVKIPYIPLTEKMPIGSTHKLEVFEHNGKRALVVLLDSPYLESRHEYANILGATFDFPTYNPHVTLAYDIGAMEIPKHGVTGNPVVITHEYTEDLDLNWKP